MPRPVPIPPSPSNRVVPAVVLALLLAVGAGTPSPLQGQATPYVPTQDPAYGDVDALRTVGLVRSAVVGQRPWSRLTVARYAVEARGRLEEAGPERPKARFIEALERLETRFAAEIALLSDEDDGSSGDAASGPGPSLTPRSAELRGSWADSPGREAFTPYEFADYIDASVNPLLQRNEGRELADGGTAAAEAVVDLSLGSAVAAQLQPRLSVAEDPAGGVEGDATLVRGYLRAVAGNFAVEAGRNPVSHGQGVDGGAALSRNARGLDMLRISTDRPARLPWIFGALGPLAASGFVGHMGDDRDTPGSALVVGAVSFRPHPNLELGGLVLNHQGGAGAPDASVADRLKDVFFISPQGEPISDKVIAGDVRLTLPSIRTELYSEVATTDDHRGFSEPDQAFGTEAIWIWGGRVRGLGSAGRLDLWAEGRKAGVRPHTHHQFSSGLTVDGRVLGDPLGPLATGVSGGGVWREPSWSLGLTAAVETYRSDMHLNIDGDDCFCWVEVEEGPDERRVRLTADFVPDPRPGGLATAVRVGWEAVERFAFTSDDRTNLLAEIRLEYRW